MNECNCKNGSTPKVIEVILHYVHRGKGVTEDPSRLVMTVTCVHGYFIAEDDPHTSVG